MTPLFAGSTIGVTGGLGGGLATTSGRGVAGNLTFVEALNGTRGLFGEGPLDLAARDGGLMGTFTDAGGS